MKWIDNVKSPMRGVKNMNFQVSYALSRFDNSGGGVNPGANITAAAADQDFIVPALDNQNVNRYFGPSTLDRTHQISFGGFVDIPFGFQFGIMSHFYSPLAITRHGSKYGSGRGRNLPHRLHWVAALRRIRFQGRRLAALIAASTPAISTGPSPTTTL